ncbi:hypothetical protein P153DRAFT_368076 [Dothidotthia symphoricarpi CBS 119687]|uniref:Uncharacterized protein n=1 Tax=Dothidotthia symphoricarpi CBS 119687 TaxID=1392245 RepID=A0A6A6AAW4_9PLEO|nr:uncharacterized protein P153DRAFT_368076 [Dothidotthia symphoricarpi CBS 119687]KAF2128204.1 hypothetical protein P153DRAFT_368076 [Dothidotthia symphoricarpi CBS 119687]
MSRHVAGLGGARGGILVALLRVVGFFAVVMLCHVLCVGNGVGLLVEDFLKQIG